ncbi:hypothetical protein KYC5002_49280 [Archangium violaceum]|uniref:hypothetical protein n=1 Tax=Archangium violaceum TaxID=83451 RepID=UPI002B30D247|nr:hypothetical protein KYC5002_49280 [Archangium gephyra]
MSKAPQLKNQFQRYWYQRHHDTARFVRACYDEISAMSALKLHALCKLTWCNRAKSEMGFFGVAETTGSLTVPALETLFGKSLQSKSFEALSVSLDEAGISKPVRHVSGKRIGFVNIYPAYRNTSKKWLDTHKAAVQEIFAQARQLASDADRRILYERIATLPDIPRKKGGPLPAANLLTPVIACLDPQVRSPIINSSSVVVDRLMLLGRLHATLPKQFDGLVSLVGKPGVPDAFVLDVTGPEVGHDPESTERELFEAEEELFTPAIPRSESLPIKNEEDIKVVANALRTKHTQLHNRMTNRLLELCKAKKLTVVEGRLQSCRFDALVRAHQEGRDLLIEVKSTTEIADIRLAVGQLLDYRRQLPKKTTTNIAVLLPSAPGEHARALLDDVEAKALWFTKDLKAIQGF